MLVESVFSFYIADSNVLVPGLDTEKHFGKYKVYIDKNTPYISAVRNNCECAIFGIATNVVTGDCVDLAEKILLNANDIQQVIDYERHLGGKYILLYKNDDYYYVLGDATCSIPIYYNVDADFACSSNYINVKRAKGYSADSEYEKIRNSGNLSQAMPYDITPCREIRQLLPNHYLEIHSIKAKRFINAKENQSEIFVEEAANTIRPMIENLVGYYSSLYKLFCPITAGRDSRVILACLMNNSIPFKSYTIKHLEHDVKDSDIVIPGDICDKLNIPYELIEDVRINEEMIDEADDMFGENNYSQRTLRIAQTIKKHYFNGAILNGDIIGQVGKCSLHRDIPEVFATPAYFRCKLHNYSTGARKQQRLWLNEIKNDEEKVNVFDLFSVENRMGRWAGQENLIYNSIGQVYLNVFNSRSIIYSLTAVKRSERKKSLIHTSLIKQWCPNLENFPYKKSANKLINLSKANWLTYLLSSYIKYYIDKKKFKEENLYEEIDNNG